MEQVLIAIISGIVAITVAVITVRGKWKQPLIEKAEAETGMGPSDRRLMQILNDTVSAQAKQIDVLRETIDSQHKELEDKEAQIADLTHRVSNLEKLTIAQALTIEELRKVSRRRRTQEGGELQTND